MAITSGFFNSLEGDRKYDARQMGEMFDGLIMDGVFMSIGDALKTTPSSGMTVAVGTGRAWFLHTWTKNDSEYLIEVSAAESVLNRIDTIVLDLDNTEAVRNNTIKLIKGTPASNAKRATLINTTDHKQIPLADILVPAGATALATTNITNIVGTSECPYVTGPLSIIQNDDILAAWQEEFDTWFEDVKGTLGSDTAGNLYNLIQQKVDKTSVLDTMDEVNLTTEKGFVAGALAVKELNSKTEFEDLTLDISTSNWKTGYCTLKAKNGVLYMDYYIQHGSDAQASFDYLVGIIPAEYRPQRSYDIRSAAWCANLNGQRYGANVRINAQGGVFFVGGGTFREAGFSFAIPID